jgi:dihydrofolate reductase
MKLKVILIAAVSADGFISREQGVPWDLAADRAHFRRLTAGKCLLLGRRTFDEMLGWFRDHKPLVLTRRPLAAPWEGASVASAQAAVERATAEGEAELWVCGGASVYAAALPLASEVILTRVAQDLGAGVAFPKLEEVDWHCVRVEAGYDEAQGLNWEWQWYERRWL